MDMNQVTVEVQDFGEAITFYTKIGLLLIVSERDEYARFELPSGSSTFSFYVSDHPVVGNTVLYFEVEDVDAKFSDLNKKGVIFESPPTDQTYRWRTAHFNDPTGNKLCIFHAGNDRRFPPWRLTD